MRVSASIRLLRLTALLCLTALPALPYAKFQGYAQKGGVTVTINAGLTSAPVKFQASYPQATVTVRNSSDNSIATIYSDNAGTAKSNPFTADLTGFWSFYASGGDVSDCGVAICGSYTITFSGTGVSSPFSWSGVTSLDPAIAVLAASQPYSVLSFGARGNNSTDDFASFQACLDASTGSLCFVPALRTYKLFTGVTVNTRSSLSGDSPFAKSTINYTGTGDIVANTSAAIHFTIKDLSLFSLTAANGVHLNGTTGNGQGVEVSGILFSPYPASGVFSLYTHSCIEIESTFLVRIINNDCQMGGNGPLYGVSMEGTFNDTIVVDSNNITGTKNAGIYCKTFCFGLSIINNVSESNSSKGLWIDAGNPITNIDIRGNHFEGNSIVTPSYDVAVAPGGATPTTFNGNWQGLTVDNNVSINPNGLGFLYVSGMRDARITNNSCDAGPGLITLGPGVIRPYVANNGACKLVGETGLTIDDSLSPVNHQNLFTYSVDLSNAAWTLAGTGAVIDQVGSPVFDNGTPAWRLNIASATSVSPVTLNGGYTTTVAGRFFSTGFWAKTDSGTALAHAGLATGVAVYTGTVAASLQDVLLNSDRYTWVSISTTTAASDASASIAASLSVYPVSGATHIYIAQPLLCADTMNCAYVSTAAGIAGKGSSPIGHTLFSQLGTATAGSQPIFCDDCLPGNPPVATYAALSYVTSGALAIPIAASGTWTTANAGNNIYTETGINGFLVGTYPGAPGGIAVGGYPPNGLVVHVYAAHTLTGAASNTFRLASTACNCNLPIVSSRNPANNIATGYVSGAVIHLQFNAAIGTHGSWLDLSQ